jgi:tRNA A37 threonylcarbamoyladenosine biosynthesis protein TsaE
LQSHDIVKLENKRQSSNAASKNLQRKTFSSMQRDVNILVSLISDRDKDDRIITIYGMGGSGKTTLTKQIFNHRDVHTSVESFAWVAVFSTIQCRESLTRYP